MKTKRKRMLAIEGAGRARREAFNGLPIVDATADFTLIVRTRDVKAARGSEKDATNCILAKACAKQVGASIVAFFRRTAYLELPDSKGNRRVVRYILDNDAAAIVAAFDRGRSIRGEVTVTLKAPRPSQTLDVIREKGKKRSARKRAVLRGEIVDTSKANTVQFHKKPTLAVRKGNGLVKNIVKRKR